MVFNCRQCGTCCMYMGDYIEIEHQISEFEFECSSVSTGTPFLARVDADKREIFRDKTWSEEHSTPCRFLRPDGNLIRCTIHETSPPQCKYYRCVVMRVYDPAGTLLGMVTGNLSLHSDNLELRQCWQEAERKISHLDADAEVRFCRMLESKGYRVE
ncbi:MAG: YkgJ family cysteine cluster protein [Methanoregula sp.]|nr:YkgJ family cysteine cluster protein [Methanoregula sp.]